MPVSHNDEYQNEKKQMHQRGRTWQLSCVLLNASTSTWPSAHVPYDIVRVGTEVVLIPIMQRIYT